MMGFFWLWGSWFFLTLPDRPSCPHLFMWCTFNLNSPHFPCFLPGKLTGQRLTCSSRQSSSASLRDLMDFFMQYNSGSLGFSENDSSNCDSFLIASEDGKTLRSSRQSMQRMDLCVAFSSKLFIFQLNSPINPISHRSIIPLTLCPLVQPLSLRLHTARYTHGMRYIFLFLLIPRVFHHQMPNILAGRPPHSCDS